MTKGTFEVDSINLQNLIPNPPFKPTVFGSVKAGSGTTLTTSFPAPEGLDDMTIAQIKALLIGQVRKDVGLED
ncbi:MULTISPECIES: hypothetical protein [Pseudomonas]|uniref:hypothetical protein n=1 Tax=Pseudomonas TaxID=286 RepID=UPI00051DBDF2|nr:MULTISPECIES: hypothetical protein [Pseudomonas]KGK25555.1 hypothetical protein GT93_12225 [Pseudomonas plecoglossicida]MBO2889559.1 hypothetical protein [Pseudomonas asiatica]MCK2124419.1 hypothetical protein [Pseudomonas sp. PNPG3]QUN70168.1 hypothetical protein KDB76_13150 [Pseudomonas sp. JS425]